MKRLIALAILVIFSSSCNDENPGNVNIRLSNASAYDFFEVKVSDGSQLHEFGYLGKGESSQYQNFSDAYRYTYVEAKIDDKLYVIQPIDYVGEETLNPGNYTYVLNANTEEDNHYGRLSLTLEKE